MLDGHAAAAGLAGLADTAQVQVVAADPPLATAAWADLSARLGRLFAQFREQGRIRAHALELVADGAAVVMAWEGDAPLSGCSRDALARELLQAEAAGSRLLSAPPLVVEVQGRARAVGRSELRTLLVSGALDGAAPWYDLRVESLGEWRRHGCVRLDQSPLGRQLLAERGQT